MKNNTKMNISLSKRIKVSAEIADLLVSDAKRCKRTVPAQIEAILCAYYETEDAGLLKPESPDVLDAEVIL